MARSNAPNIWFQKVFECILSQILKPFKQAFKGQNTLGAILEAGSGDMYMYAPACVHTAYM